MLMLHYRPIHQIANDKDQVSIFIRFFFIYIYRSFDIEQPMIGQGFRCPSVDYNTGTSPALLLGRHAIDHLIQDLNTPRARCAVRAVHRSTCGSGELPIRCRVSKFDLWLP